jgi:uncharacterized SAM-binding protein YcdF (DUF218 family)
MLILHRILPLLVLPPGICLVLMVAGLMLRKRLLVRLGLMLLWVLSLPLVADSLMRGIERPYRRIPVERMHKADAVVVLSGMIEQTEGAPLGEWSGAADRFEGGIELFRSGKAPMLVFTFGQVPWQSSSRPEGPMLAKRAMALGVPGSAIRVTGYGANTAEEALAVSALTGVGKGQNKRIILVTSAFHMNRAAMLFRRAGFVVEPYPVDFRDHAGMRTTVLSFLPDAEALDHSATAMREALGIGFYLVKGL